MIFIEIYDISRLVNNYVHQQHRRLLLFSEHLNILITCTVDCSEQLFSILFRINSVNVKNSEQFHQISRNKKCMLNFPAKMLKNAG